MGSELSADRVEVRSVGLLQGAGDATMQDLALGGSNFSVRYLADAIVGEVVAGGATLSNDLTLPHFVERRNKTVDVGSARLDEQVECEGATNCRRQFHGFTRGSGKLGKSRGNDCMHLRRQSPGVLPCRSPRHGNLAGSQTGADGFDHI
jgi:hypothetical protein